MSRIVLVDPAAKDSTGHHIRILQKFAESFGEERCYYAVNTKCGSDVGLPHAKTYRIFEPTIYDLWQYRLYGRAWVRLERWFESGTVIKKRDTRFMIREVLNQIRHGKSQIMRRTRLTLAAILGVLAIPIVAFRPYNNSTPALSVFTEDLLYLIRKLALGPNDHIVIPSAETELAAAVLALAVELNPAQMPNIHIRFMYTNESLLTSHYDYENIFMRLRATQLVGKRIHVYTETAAYAQVLNQYFDEPIEDIPYPVDFIPSALKSDEKIVFGVLGAAREEKGFRRLGAILREFSIRHPNLVKRAVFKIQAGGQSRETNDLVDSFNMETATLGLNIDIVYGNISEKEYESLRQETDVFLLPYSPQLYGIRGSGVVFEAVGASRPFICSKGVSFEELNSHGNALSADDNIDFADAIAQMVEGYEGFRQNAELAAAALLARVNDNGLLQTCKANNPVVPFTPPPKLLVVSPWYPSGGSETVFMAQLDTFRHLGVQTVSIFMEATPIVLRDGSDDAKAFNKHANSGPVGYANATMSFKTYYCLKPKNWINWFISAAIYDRFLSVDTRARAAHELPNFIKRVAKAGNFDAILVNHIHQSGLAERIPGYFKKPKIIETHDIQSMQYEIRRGYLSPDELDDEAKRIEKFDKIVWLNAREKATFETISQRKDSLLIHPAIGPKDWQPLRYWSTNRALSDIVQSSGPAWQFSSETTGFDMFFLGSRHPSNTRALERLLNELVPETITRHHPLWIAGTVCDGIFPKYYRHNVTPLQLVKNIEPLYAIAKIVLVPYAGGTGIPTKLIDATSRRKAVLIEAAAMAALDIPDLDKYEIVARSPAEFIQKLERALKDPAYRVRLADEGYELYNKYFAHSTYTKKWGEVFTSLGLKVNPIKDDESTVKVVPYTEHDDAVNWYLEALASDRKPSLSDVQRRNIFLNDDDRKKLEAIAAANGLDLTNSTKKTRSNKNKNEVAAD